MYCQTTTKKGTRCTRKVKDCGTLCYQHLNSSKTPKRAYPKYEYMILVALKELEGKGVIQKIAAYIQSYWPVPNTDNFKVQLRLALRRARDDGYVELQKNVYHITPLGKERLVFYKSQK